MKPLKVFQPGVDKEVTKNDLVRLQQQDKSLEKFSEIGHVRQKGNYEVRFEKKRGVLNRLYQNLDRTQLATSYHQICKNP